MHLNQNGADNRPLHFDFLHLLLILFPRFFPAFHLPAQILWPHAYILQWQERQARAVLCQNIARATIEHRLRRVDARLGHAHLT